MVQSKRWNSDVISDLLHAYGFDYAAINPGASFRGLHDSIVNYGGNRPELLLCQHEETAVQIAHGYAKASGKPMVAILHDLVGLLHANLAIYYAYIDRAPVFIIGATGPLDERKRRPHIDWCHTANTQGEAVRNYTKWDYQPVNIEGVPESFDRAYGIMMAEPRGPIYMCYDAMLQEDPLEQAPTLPSAAAVAAAVPSPMAADPAALEQVARMLVAAEHPVILTEYAGRHANGLDDLVRLAETAGIPVYDVNGRLNFPNRHPLNLSMDPAVFTDADLMLCLDTRDWERPTTKLDSTNRTTTSYVPEGCKWVNVGFGDLEISSWSMDYERGRHFDLRVLADTALAVPALTALCRDLLAKDAGRGQRAARRAAETAKRHAGLRARWAAEASENWDQTPMSLPRLASEVWEAIKHEDWVLTAGTFRSWARKLWDFDRPYRHPGKPLGTATQIGMSLGVALAHKGSGRLVVDLQPDGDLMFDAGALWVAAKHRIPMLVVMFNNRAYYNDWEHQIRMARQRGTPEERAHIGMDLSGPEPDFAALAKSMGWYAEGPIENGDDVGPALGRAIEQVKAGTPALLDTITQRR